MPLLEDLSGIREVVVSNFIDFLIDKLTSTEFQQLATEKEDHEEMQKLVKELKEIRSVLGDAEERQLKEPLVKNWLTDLQNLAYEMEDVFDEFATVFGKINLILERQGRSSKRPRFNYPYSLIFKTVVMPKIKELTAKLKDLEPRKNQLRLRIFDSKKLKRQYARLQPTSVTIEANVYGRDRDKQEILDLLLKSEGNFVIPIVGMGGIGKTTLAQLIYNDASVQNHFHLKAWVCVSEDFDVARITKEILKSVTSKPCDENDLNKLQEMLKKELSEKKFLIVLDDVWNENYHDWTILQFPFLTGTLGSKIIVTTRSHGVSSTMGASYYSLEVLSDDDCMSVFSQHALGARDFGGHPNLKDVAEKIVRKCNGLPLAAKTLGCLLRSNVDLYVWEDISESEIWQLSEEHQCGIIPALQLSYHHLPPHLKWCFAYCSIIPKDYEFEEEEIILLWRAQGFLQEARDRQCIDDLGRKYFRDLVSRSLFQISIKDTSRFVMHDLINDLAESVAGEICFKIDGTRQISKHARHLSYVAHKYDGIKKFEGISEVQQLRTFLLLRISQSQGFDSYIDPGVLTYLLPNLRCLRALSLEGYQIKELSDFLGDLKHLRYLNFSNNRVIKRLPESVCSLYNLETLLLKGCDNLEKLPSEMEKLVNLCYLDIRGADRLEGIPSSILTNLQTVSNFVLKGELRISELQNAVEHQDKWTAYFHENFDEVQKRSGTQPFFFSSSLNVSTDMPSNLPDLKIERYGSDENQTVPPQVSPSMVQQDQDDTQTRSSLSEDGNQKFSPSATMSLTVPTEMPTDLDSHRIDRYGSDDNQIVSTQLSPSIVQLETDTDTKPSSSEIGNQTFYFSLGFNVSTVMFTVSKITHLCLSDLNFSSLPPLGMLPILEHLIIQRIEGIRSIGHEFYRLDSTFQKPFQSLKILKFEAMLQWEWWTPLESEGEEFPYLQEISIINCPKLEGDLPKCLPSLIKLEISECQQLAAILPWTSKHCVPKLENCDKVLKRSDDNLTVSPQVSPRIVQQDQDDTQTRPFSSEDGNQQFSSMEIPSDLHTLRIERYASDVLPKEILESSSLQHLYLIDCVPLKIFPSSPSLKTLFIHSCKSLEFPPPNKLMNQLEGLCLGSSCDSLETFPLNYFPKLKSLSLWDCRNLESLSVDKELQAELISLDSLEIKDCPKLRSFLEEEVQAPNLTSLVFFNCGNLKSLQSIQSFKSLQSLYINKCPALESFPMEGLPSGLIILCISFCDKITPQKGWNLDKLHSLSHFEIEGGCLTLKSFPDEGLLPTNLKTLRISGLLNLASLDGDGLQKLTSLQTLEINSCNNLDSLPEDRLSSSLSSLSITDCPILNAKLRERKGKEWFRIAHIPSIHLDEDSD